MLRVNRQAFRLWGKGFHSLEPIQRFFGAFRIEDLQGRPFQSKETPMARAALSGESFEGIEAVIQNPDGKRWVARLNVAPLRDVGGTVVGAITCFQDVTR